MKPSTQVKLLELRNLLQQISHISYTFSKINREYPMETMDEETAKEVEKAYIDLIRQVSQVNNNFNLLHGNSTT